MLRLDEVRVEWIGDGVRAAATVSYEIGNGDRRLETLTSGGLWGIDDENPTSLYRRELEDEQLEDLREHLTKFGVPVHDFDAKVRR